MLTTKIMDTLNTFKKYLGCIYGLAIGDALGFPVEFMPLELIKARYGSEGLTDFQSASGFPKGTYTDDTQMTLAIAEALIKSPDDSKEKTMDEISNQFVKWANSLDNNRAPGSSCMAGVRNLERGVHWSKSGVKNADGCGAVMRVAPIGLVYAYNLDKLKEIAAASATCTHDSPTARESAVATAYAVSLALRDFRPMYDLPVPGQSFPNRKTDVPEYLEKIVRVSGVTNSRLLRKLSQVNQVITQQPDKAFERLGDSWVSDEALASALYSVFYNEFQFRDSVLTAANTNGDSDSIACISGAIAGAYHGIDAIPANWIKQIENPRYLFDVSKRLFLKAYRIRFPENKIEFLEEMSDAGFDEMFAKRHELEAKLKQGELTGYTRMPSTANSLEHTDTYIRGDCQVRLHSYVNQKSGINFLFRETTNLQSNPASN